MWKSWRGPHSAAEQKQGRIFGIDSNDDLWLPVKTEATSQQL